MLKVRLPYSPLTFMMLRLGKSEAWRERAVYLGLSDRRLVFEKVRGYLKKKVAHRTGYSAVPVLGP